MPSYSSVGDDIKEGIWNIKYTRFKKYGKYTIYLDNVLYDFRGGDIVTRRIPDNISLDNCKVRNENKNEVPFNELPDGIKRKIIEEIL